MKFSTILTLATLLTTGSIAQNTVGVIQHNAAESFPGYNLLFPHNQSNVYLLDNCGRIAHVWEDSIYVPGNWVQLDEQGNIIRAVRPQANPNYPISGHGAGGLLEKKDWDNNVLWRWEYNDSTVRLHHDITLMPNGNILAIAWEYKSLAEAIAAGRDTAFMEDSMVYPDHVIEVKPVGTDSAQIVWAWHAWDHLIQDYDSTKASYGNPAAHPELIDLNYGDPGADWLHINGIAYNPEFDQIALSVPEFDEIWIIDHSTTKAEAAGHQGGLADKGGDLLYRWGNPEAYRQGDSTDQKLFYQHDIHWMDMELSSTHPDYGKLLVFNNRVDGWYSSVNIINPTFDDYLWGYPLTGNKWGPSDFDWTYVHPDTLPMYSNIISSAQRLKNGNTLICAGRNGHSLEINSSGHIVWEYITPLDGGQPVAQGDTIPDRGNLTFKLKRYSPGYPAFDGKDLSPKGYLELNPDTTCDLTSAIAALLQPKRYAIYPNPADDQLTIALAGRSKGPHQIEVFNLLGKRVKAVESFGSVQMDVRTLKPGIYLIRIDGVTKEKVVIGR